MATIRCAACGASIQCVRTVTHVIHVHYGNSFRRTCFEVQEHLRRNGHWSNAMDRCPNLEAALIPACPRA